MCSNLFVLFYLRVKTNPCKVKLCLKLNMNKHLLHKSAWELYILFNYLYLISSIILALLVQELILIWVFCTLLLVYSPNQISKKANFSEKKINIFITRVQRLLFFGYKIVVSVLLIQCISLPVLKRCALYGGLYGRIYKIDNNGQKIQNTGQTYKE